jgi:hypothetical protein
LIQAHLEAAIVVNARRRSQQLKVNDGAAFETTWERLAFKKCYLVGTPMIAMKDPVDTGFEDRLVGAEERLRRSVTG